MVKKIKNYLLSEEEWIFVEQLLCILRPFYEFTIKLQSEDCTLSDFYGYWMAIIYKLKNLIYQTEFIAKLKHQMDSYKNQLLNNPVLVSAVYLDPRYQRSLTSDKRDLAVFYLTGLFGKVTSLESNGTTDQQIHNLQTDDSFVAFLDSLGSRSNRIEQIDQETAERITMLLKKIDGFQVNSHILSATEYWKKNKILHPEIFNLAKIIFAVPPTQTSVERAFSAFAIILTPRRSRLSDDVLQNILLVRLNSGMLI